MAEQGTVSFGNIFMSEIFSRLKYFQVSTLKLTYSCCHGFKNTDGRGCSSVEMTPLEETIADLGGSQFLELMVEHGLDRLMDNVTVFVPNDDAIQDFTRELEDVGLVGEENIVYNIDDGLLNKRRKRNIQISEGPAVADILAGHVVDGYHNIRDLVDSELVQSQNSEKNRFQKYFHVFEIFSCF